MLLITLNFDNIGGVVLPFVTHVVHITLGEFLLNLLIVFTSLIIYKLHMRKWEVSDLAVQFTFPLAIDITQFYRRHLVPLPVSLWQRPAVFSEYLIFALLLLVPSFPYEILVM
ncbi:hypothetical protein ALC56_08146 [Trachymyrmex septentrionalis]|uniref:Uncharacterized protein n=1 Tax=Trachymyrmex septentrionalis TaxID=34720 RepID=A0A151JVB3_9HYME|nr:hypothetical protein ALC56_08146 [Trachymyrmex septentrionalis]